MDGNKLTEEKNRFKIILQILAKEYPFANIQLEHSSPFELLVATMLSAQCTDKRVNEVTAKLFIKYKSPEDFIKLPAEELEKEIFSTGYYKAKAKHIKATSVVINNNFNGKVPNTMEKLLTLPGIGRKSANVILGYCFNTPGVVVDTHVIRISNRLGFVQTNNADKIEKILEDLIPKNKWVAFTHYFINHGRQVCVSRKPKCNICTIAQLCPSKK